jgi:quercetin dioxygenase-like cupin family protein
LHSHSARNPAPHAQDGFKRTDLQKHDLSILGAKSYNRWSSLAPGAVVARHTHPGEEVSVMLEGELLLEIAGMPPVTMKAGQAFTVPKGRGARP